MQTFLPYEDFDKSAQSLDRQRLGKQRVETMQIMNAILDPDYGWQNHPAVNMWRGHLISLMDYQFAVCSEWVNRGYKDTCLEKTFALVDQYSPDIRIGKPKWVGNYEFHISHQSNLLRKLPEHYSKYFVNVPDDLPYIWPES